MDLFNSYQPLMLTRTWEYSLYRITGSLGVVLTLYKYNFWQLDCCSTCLSRACTHREEPVLIIALGKLRPSPPPHMRSAARRVGQLPARSLAALQAPPLYEHRTPSAQQSMCRPATLSLLWSPNAYRIFLLLVIIVGFRAIFLSSLPPLSPIDAFPTLGKPHSGPTLLWRLGWVRVYLFCWTFGAIFIHTVFKCPGTLPPRCRLLFLFLFFGSRCCWRRKLENAIV